MYSQINSSYREASFASLRELTQETVVLLYKSLPHAILYLQPIYTNAGTFDGDTKAARDNIL